MKNFLLFTLLLLTSLAQAQETGKSTDAFQITGKVQNALTVKFSDLQQYPLQKIGNVKITSHTGEPRGEFKKLKGVLLKSVLEKATIQAENPKILSEYYIVCKASDGYKMSILGTNYLIQKLEIKSLSLPKKMENLLQERIKI